MAGAAIATRSWALRDQPRSGVRKCLLMALVALVALISPVIAEPTYPELTGRITDQAGLLTAADKADIESQLASLEQTSTDQLAVVTVKSLDGYSIEDYGIGLARKWGIGQKGKDNGILLIVAPNDRKVRIEVGRRLEPMMTDTMSTLIIENAILPKFRRGDFGGGIKDGVRDIKTVLLGDAEEVKQRAARRTQPAKRSDRDAACDHLAADRGTDRLDQLSQSAQRRRRPDDGTRWPTPHATQRRHYRDSRRVGKLGWRLVGRRQRWRWLVRRRWRLRRRRSFRWLVAMTTEQQTGGCEQ